MTNLKLALRRLRAAPVFAVFSILTLACGIGITTAAYSAIYAVGGRPLDVAAPDTLALLTRSTAAIRTRPVGVTAGEARALAELSALQGVGGYAGTDGVLAGPVISELVGVELVTGSYFDVVGAPIVAGRALTAKDDEPGAAPVLVLSHLSWRRHFDASPQAIGSRIRFAGREFEVVGVAGRGFRGVGTRLVGGVSAWLPEVHTASLRGTAAMTARMQGRPINVVVRRAATTDLNAASEAVAAAGRALDASAPLPRTGPPATPPAAAPLRNWALTSLPEATDFGESEVARVVMMVPLLVLLVACTNLANLVLSRSASRRHEYAVRRALGASRWQLLREALIESAVVIGCGALLGAGVADGLLTAGMAMAREPVQAMTFSAPLDWQLDPILLSAAGASAILCFLVAGLFPALRMTRADPGRSLTTGDAVQYLPKWRGRSNLIALQLGLSTAMFLVTVIAARFVLVDPPPIVQRDPSVSGLTIAEFHVDAGASPTRSERVTAVVNELRGRSGVGFAAAATALPMGLTRGFMMPVDITRNATLEPETPQMRLTQSRNAALIATSPDFFNTLGVALVAGRDFLHDAAADADAVIVDEHVARQHFGEAPAVGQDLVVHGDWRRENRLTRRRFSIVGVAPGRTMPDGRPRKLIYVPLSERTDTSMALIARPADGQRPLVDEIRASIRAVDPDLAIGAAGSGRVMAERGFGVMRLLALVLAALATLTLVLATAGLYGVLTDVVTRRTRELGIRVAFGASARRIAALILRQGARPLVEGMFIGLASAAVIRHLMQQQLSATLSGSSLLIGAAAIVPLLFAGLIAAYLPARRASRVNPMVALRRL